MTGQIVTGLPVEALEALPRLDSFDPIEWQSFAAAIKPGLTEAEYDDMMVRFVAMKNRRALH